MCGSVALIGEIRVVGAVLILTAGLTVRAALSRLLLIQLFAHRVELLLQFFRCRLDLLGGTALDGFLQLVDLRLDARLFARVDLVTELGKRLFALEDQILRLILRVDGVL